MIKRQSLGLTQKTDTALRVESGVWYPVRGIGQALVMLPFYIIGERLFYTFGLNEGLKGYFMEGICSLSSALLSALLCFVFFLFLLGMGYSLKSSTITTFILGLATVIWPYSKSTFNQMLTALMLLTTLYTLYVFKINKSLYSLFYAGLSFSFLLLTRLENIFLLPLLIIYLWYILRKEKLLFYKLIIFVIPIFLAGIWFIIYNRLRFGSMFITGFERFAHYFSINLAMRFNYLFGPNNSIFLYSPPIIIAFFFIKYFFKDKKAEFFLFLSVIIFYFLFYGSFFSWAGGWCWGPRFMLPITPLLLIPVVYLFEHRKRSNGYFFFLVLIGAGIFLQIIAISVNYYEALILYRYVPPKTRELFTFPQIFTQLKLFIHKLSCRNEIYEIGSIFNINHRQIIDLSRYESFQGFNFWVAHILRQSRQVLFLFISSLIPLFLLFDVYLLKSMYISVIKGSDKKN